MTAGRKDNPAFEFASATVPAPGPGEAHALSETARAALMARRALRLIAGAAADPRTLLMAVQRAAGLELTEIGALHGMSKQAVHKRLAALAARSPALAAWLRVRPAYDPNIAGSQDVVALMHEHDIRRRRMTSWMKRPN